MNHAQQTVVLHLDPEDQEMVIAQAREVLRQAPLVRPTTPNGTPMRVRVSAAGALGWVGDGEYRYSPTQANGSPWPEMPQAWRELASMAAGRSYPWDSAILNWYEPGSGLGWHRDKAEADRSLPIVTVSLGDAATWAVREDDTSPISRCRLESGDVTLLEWPRRSWLHAIERIHPTPMFSPLRESGRLSITIRVAGRAQGG